MTQNTPADTSHEPEYRPDVARPVRPVPSPSAASAPGPAAAPAAPPMPTPAPAAAPPMLAPAPDPPMHAYLVFGPLTLRVEAGEHGPRCLVAPASLASWLGSRSILCSADRMAKLVSELRAIPELAAEVGSAPDNLLTREGARAVIGAVGAGINGVLAERALERAFERARASTLFAWGEPGPASPVPPRAPTPTTRAPRLAPPATEGPTLADLNREERDAIIGALRKTRQNRTEAAKLLGVPRRTFYRKLREYGIVVDD